VISRVLQLSSGAATIDGEPCAYLQDDHGLASLLPRWPVAPPSAS
jgi:hypothetical protein